MVSRSGLAYTRCQNVSEPKWHHEIARLDARAPLDDVCARSPTRGKFVDRVTLRARNVAIVSTKSR